MEKGSVSQTSVPAAMLLQSSTEPKGSKMVKSHTKTVVKKAYWRGKGVYLIRAHLPCKLYNQCRPNFPRAELAFKASIWKS